jgi:hypothetical protein
MRPRAAATVKAVAADVILKIARDLSSFFFIEWERSSPKGTVTRTEVKAIGRAAGARNAARAPQGRRGRAMPSIHAAAVLFFENSVSIRAYDRISATKTPTTLPGIKLPPRSPDITSNTIGKRTPLTDSWMRMSMSAERAQMAIPSTSAVSLGSDVNILDGIYMEATAKNRKRVGSFAEYIKGLFLAWLVFWFKTVPL